MFPLHEGSDTGKIALAPADLRLLPDGGLDYRHYIARGRHARADAAASLFGGLGRLISGAFARLTGQAGKTPTGQPC